MAAERAQKAPGVPEPAGDQPPAPASPQPAPAVNIGFTPDGPGGLPASPFYLATAPILFAAENGADAAPVRAFNPGDRVPAEHVERYGLHSYVTLPPNPDGD